jgi:O-6-methylguanine DNA methyltransferase
MFEYCGVPIKLIGDRKLKKVEFGGNGGREIDWDTLSQLDIDLSCFNDFEIAVYQAVRKIPYGRVSTYKEIARHIGRENASRAVGNALAKNPLAIVVPCHRIVKSDLTIGGFTGGVDIKRRLLESEGVEFCKGKVKKKYMFRFYRF